MSNILLYVEAVALLIAATILTFFLIILIRLSIAMHRNVKLLIGGVIVTYQLYVIIRLLSIVLAIIDDYVTISAWIETIVNIGRVCCSLTATIDSLAFIVERAIASIFPKTYEHHSQSSIVSIVFTIEVR